MTKQIMTLRGGSYCRYSYSYPFLLLCLLSSCIAPFSGAFILVKNRNSNSNSNSNRTPMVSSFTKQPRHIATTSTIDSLQYRRGDTADDGPNNNDDDDDNNKEDDTTTATSSIDTAAAAISLRSRLLTFGMPNAKFTRARLRAKVLEDANANTNTNGNENVNQVVATTQGSTNTSTSARRERIIKRARRVQNIKNNLPRRRRNRDSLSLQTSSSTSSSTSTSPRRRRRRASTRTSSSSSSSTPLSPPVIVTNAQELRHAVFDQGVELKDIEFRNVTFQPSNYTSASTTTANAANTNTNNGIQDDINDVLNHEVIQLIQKRFETKSKPGARSPDDDAHLALSIEGGGMRGAVSAGMASAIAVLGLSDTFDSIYGSSAGSVIGAYMVSRQMCIDVYTDVLTTAKGKFVSKGRLASSLATNLFDTRILNSTSDVFSRYVSPAMNISFVLDSIMCPKKGLRPLDLETFRINDEVQQLRVVTSTVRDGKMETHCLGSNTMDFFDRVDDETGEVLEYATTNVKENGRHGFFASLETSMLVPAATGPPQPLLRHRDASQNITTTCFDAFCYEPIPYRSAVKEGATHVLVLKSRPTGSPIGTKPGLFEKVFAPMYFDRNGMPEVSTYFKNGGQQYIYTEDYLTLEEGRKNTSKDGVHVPPSKILYGVERDDEANDLVANRDNWDKAHLFPLAVPEGRPELSALSVDTDEVCEAVRLGFASAFDILAPVTGVTLNSHLDGDRVAELLFSHSGKSSDALKDPVSIAGVSILDRERESMSGDQSETIETTSNSETEKTDDISLQVPPRSLRYMYNSSNLDEMTLRQELFDESGKFMDDGIPRPPAPCPRQDASELLESLPGFHQGRMESLSLGLRELRRGSRGRTKI